MTACRKMRKQNVDEKKLVGVLSTDMSKNFDSLRLSLLITKLRAYDHSYGMYSKMICALFNNAHCALFPYADDHQLSHAAETIKEVEPILNEEGNKSFPVV